MEHKIKAKVERDLAEIRRQEIEAKEKEYLEQLQRQIAKSK
jgi:hypothetical protein